MTRLIPIGALALALAAPLVPATAQRVVPARIDAVPRVDLTREFQRLDRYNAAVQLANEARARVPKLQAKMMLNGLASIGFIALTATQYQESMKKLNEGDGSGYDTPAMISALSFGAAIWTTLTWFDARRDLRDVRTREQSHLDQARAALPGRDPARER